MNPLQVFKSPMWRWPVVLGLLSAVALGTALVTDGPVDLVAALVLGLPVVLGTWCAFGGRPPG